MCRAGASRASSPCRSSSATGHRRAHAHREARRPQVQPRRPAVCSSCWPCRRRWPCTTPACCAARREQNRRLQALWPAPAAAMTSTLDLDELLATIAEAAGQALDTDECAINIYDPATRLHHHRRLLPASAQPRIRRSGIGRSVLAGRLSRRTAHTSVRRRDRRGAACPIPRSTRPTARSMLENGERDPPQRAAACTKAQPIGHARVHRAGRERHFTDEERRGGRWRWASRRRPPSTTPSCCGAAEASRTGSWSCCSSRRAPSARAWTWRTCCDDRGAHRRRGAGRRAVPDPGVRRRGQHRHAGRLLAAPRRPARARQHAQGVLAGRRARGARLPGGEGAWSSSSTPTPALARPRGTSWTSTATSPT